MFCNLNRDKKQNSESMRNISLVLLFVAWSNCNYAQLSVKSLGRIMELNKAKIYIEEYGQGEPLFLLHGFLSTADSWKNFIETYSQHYRVIVWAMRGHGRSSDPNNQNDFK